MKTIQDGIQLFSHQIYHRTQSSGIYVFKPFTLPIPLLDSTSIIIQLTNPKVAFLFKPKLHIYHDNRLQAARTGIFVLPSYANKIYANKTYANLEESATLYW